MKYKKKSNFAIVLMLVLTLLLAGCVSVYTAFEFSGNQNNDNIENGYKLENMDENETELLALSVKDVYKDDFGAASDDFASSFETIIAGLVIPDARKGESAPDIRAGYEAWNDSSIIFLGSIPEENIYLYGYNDAEFGLILDVGEEQTIYAFPYRYMSIQSIAPELGISSDRSEIYVACRIQSGTGVSIYELYVFPIDNISGAYRLSTNDLVESLNSKINMLYNSETEMVSTYWAGQKIAESGLSVIGASAYAEIIPESFFCGNQVNYELDGDVVKLICTPTIYIQGQPGAQVYLTDEPYFEAALSFVYDDKGTITGFVISQESGDISTNNTTQTNVISSAMDAFKSVLKNNTEFYSTSANESLTLCQLNKAVSSDSNVSAEVTKFAIVDLDNDGIAEVVLWLLVNGNDYYGCEVLRYQDGKVYGYTLWYRAFNTIKTDGTFSFSSSASSMGFGSVSFNNDSYAVKEIARRETDSVTGELIYAVDNKIATEREFNFAMDTQNAKADITWYDFTDSNIELLLTR